MPIPTPNDGESEDDFMSRCMSNDTMQGDYPDSDQRLAVCGNSWRDSKSMSDNRLTYVSVKDFKTQRDEGTYDGNLALRKPYVPEDIKQQGGKESRKFRFTISTGAVDRDGDTINPKGFDLKSFRKNPVVLFGHDGSRPPIGRASDIRVEDNAVKATVEFMDNDIDTSGFSDMIFRMVRAGFLKATSVGFLPKDFEFSEDPTRNAGLFPGIDFNKQELLEFSIVPVPSNPEALIDARAKGIDTKVLHDYYNDILDNWSEYEDQIGISKNAVKKCMKAIKPKSVFNVSPSEQDRLLEQNLAFIKAGLEGNRQLINDGILTNSTNMDVWKSILEDTDFDYSIPGNLESEMFETVISTPEEGVDVETKENQATALRETMPSDEAGNNHVHTYDPTMKVAEGEADQQTSTTNGHSHAVKFGSERTEEADGHFHTLNGWEGDADNYPWSPQGPDNIAGEPVRSIDEQMETKGDMPHDDDDEEEDEDDKGRKPRKADDEEDEENTVLYTASKTDTVQKTVWEEVCETLQKEIDECETCDGEGRLDVTTMNQKDNWVRKIVCPDCHDARDKLALAKMSPDTDKPIRIKFVSVDGIGHKCTVVDDITGRPIDGIRAIEYKAEVDHVTEARITFVAPKAELIIDGDIRQLPQMVADEDKETDSDEDTVLFLDDEPEPKPVTEPEDSFNVDTFKELLLEELPNVVKDVMDKRVRRHTGAA